MSCVFKGVGFLDVEGTLDIGFGIGGTIIDGYETGVEGTILGKASSELIFGIIEGDLFSVTIKGIEERGEGKD